MRKKIVVLIAGASLSLGLSACGSVKEPTDEPKQATAAAVEEPKKPKGDENDNLKQIVIGLNSYHDSNQRFPAAAICDKQGKKLLSWRVAILPNIGQRDLYEKFKLDEPWDSEHNKKLAETELKIYTDSRARAPKGHTYYKVFVGGGGIFDWNKSLGVVMVGDRVENTLAVAAVGDPVPWTKPEEIEYDPKKPLPPLTKAFNGELHFAYGDGKTRSVPEAKIRKDNDKILNLLIQAGDGNVVPGF